MTDVITTAPWICQCGKTREKPATRLPQGWKRKDDLVFCSECWSARYILRAITLPVVHPIDMDWKTLNSELSKMWALTTQASNWISTELYARDVRRGDEPKMPPMPPAYLYPELRKRFPGLPSSTVASLEHSAQRKYRADRYEVIWTCAKSLPTFRYPVPFPIPAQATSVSIDGDLPFANIRIGESRVRLRLKGGLRFKRQRQAIEQISSGAAVPGEVAIYRHKSESGDEIMLKFVAWLPRSVSSGSNIVHPVSGALRVRTGPTELLIAANDKDDVLWRYNGDHLRRWTAEHRTQLQRWSEDQKFEQRPVPAFAQRRSDAAAKYNNRMSSACHEIAAQLVNYGSRRRFAQIVYDDTNRAFVPQFPYFRLAALIQEKCDAIGIEFAHASTEVQEQMLEPLAKG